MPPCLFLHAASPPRTEEGKKQPRHLAVPGFLHDSLQIRPSHDGSTGPPFRKTLLFREAQPLLSRS